MSMIKIGFIYDDLKSRNNPFRDHHIEKGYELFSEIGKKKGFVVFYADKNWLLGKKLRKAWVFDKKWEKTGKQKVDIIMDKTIYSKASYIKMSKVKGIKIMNDPRFKDLIVDKYLTYKEFSKYIPKTVLINNKSDYKKALKSLKTKKIVLKERRGFGGAGLYIRNRNNPPKIRKGYVAQEFVDTSSGVAGVIKDVHDLRLFIFNGKILYHYLRIPEKGLVCNLARGGLVVNFPKTKLPKKAIKLSRKIDNKLRKFKPRFYTLDFLIGKKYIWIIELNHAPAMYHARGEAKKARISLFKAFFNELKKEF